MELIEQAESVVSNTINLSVHHIAVVPANLPKYGDSFDNRELNVIRDLEEFVDRFECVLRAHELNPDDN